MTHRTPGTVTFLFTDIEGSTRLWEQQPQSMQAALARHDVLLRRAIESHGGHVFKTIGDAFCAAFASPEEGVAAAIAAQRALRDEELPLRVRMAVHAGDAEYREGDYFGPALNRVARLLQAGHGGQVLLSAATAAQLPPELLAEIDLRSLGVHRLRDIAAREAIFQLLAPGLPARFPPLNTLDVAFRRGALRATLLAAVVVAVVAGLAVTAVDQAHRAEQQRRFAEAARVQARRSFYVAQMKLADQTAEEGSVAQARRLLDALRPAPGEEDLRSFEWRYLWRPEGSQLRTFQVGAQVDSVAYSPDGKLLALGCAGGDLVQLWDPAAGRQTVVLQGPTDHVREVVFSPDGRWLASVGYDKTVRLWDARARRLVATLKGHTTFASALAFSPDGRTLASGGEKIWLWDAPTGRPAAVLDEAVTNHALAFSPDGGTLASGNSSGVIKLWQMTGHAPQWVARVAASLSGHRDLVSCLAFSPDGRLLASGGADSTARLWDVTRRRQVALFQGHHQRVRSVRFSRDGKLLYTASDDGTIRIWSVTTRQLLMRLEGHTDQVQSLALSPDGKILASGSPDGTVRLWEAIPRRSTALLLQQKSPVTALAYSPDGGMLAVGSEDGSVPLMAVDSGRRIAVLKGRPGPVHQLAFHPGGEVLVSLVADKSVQLWREERTSAGEVRWDMASLPDVAGRADAIAFSPDGQLLAIGCEDRIVRFWRLRPPRPGSSPRSDTPADIGGEWLPPLRGFAGPVYTLRFTPDGRLLVTGSIAPTADRVSGIVSLWEAGSWREVGHLKSSFNTPLTLKISPDGKTVGTGNGPEQRSLWSLETRRLIASMEGGAEGDFAYSPDSHTLALCTPARDTITLYNLITGEVTAALRGHETGVKALAFAPDGNTLASGGTDGTVRLWRAPPFQETDLLHVIATSGNRTVQLEWPPLPHASGYDIYRGPEGASRAELVKLTSRPIHESPYTDRSPELVNGHPQSYAVSPIYQENRPASAAAHPARETLWAWLQAIPIALPVGWWGSSVNEGPQSGSAAFNTATGEVILRDHGQPIPGSSYFLWQAVDGDFQATVRVLPSPSGPPVRMRLTASESLDPNSRFAQTGLGGDGALGLGWGDGFTGSGELILEPGRVKLPILLRITRHGNTVFAWYSEDDGKSFHPGFDPMEFDPPLAKRLHVGVKISRGDPDWTGEVRLSGLKIQRR